jgi:hypothetical protein
MFERGENDLPFLHKTHITHSSLSSTYSHILCIFSIHGHWNCQKAAVFFEKWLTAVQSSFNIFESSLICNRYMGVPNQNPKPNKEGH